ncbi:hypothetical protein NLX67_10365 [Domibacillus sp. A3M-37]|uniref:hypothetical protein n=1 Tax=Domibacillus sp. A3M-37 TaxID=2962037 RepID=UPI0020B75939|nr:hypothetical protein [Domibacillus sp. A3M-37]MCP3762793.1 hypothetical protein [Domibacillus sp. A3M-37]
MNFTQATDDFLMSVVQRTFGRTSIKGYILEYIDFYNPASITIFSCGAWTFP